ncbi:MULTISPECIES: aminoglycoside phosphotransferase family protein [Gordonia]|jgi:streptomycin 6-kinase|uniref:Aminoglycoside resistance protein n=1 Tax=Gordonia alkanivorans CGMCC 6845 TaxID=1423140 RepID=W9DKY2_9ACTN|nr:MULTISPECIES: aminoglycoside phosphotransferase family protein [Gordonia]ETA07595.1 aminoglycoside resistance protein [Gordonia alkanivorans CGMCC 6845]MDH3008311.1 aminoglycoside phosphotransferase family protein [Gordonia alkanivorans]MDH3012358.1 aminoglycoside phosphotransferase family protein [Gordonia alkanivorans]MDH3017299.1 aminoglycoside phosphotransferase family protein [Gordonia alkanivorans]MDH3021846.1 aminoglycoside phosphotransferase family protein [Gordonia alkanivorans]
MIGPADIPAGLAEQSTLGPAWQDWLRRLPATASGLLDAWELRRDGEELWHGFESLVIPVIDRNGQRAVLKVAFDGDDEGAQEALGLQHWAGRGAVRMLRADPRLRALLLERLGRTDLTTVEDDEACRVVAELYGVLHIPAPGRMTPLTTHLEHWLAGLARMSRDAPVPRRFVEQALSLGRNFLSDESTVGVVVHGDLHHENVLLAPSAGRRWLAIDPSPMSGDPHYEPAPMLWNLLDRRRGDPRYVIRSRFHSIVDAAGLDPDRARDWVIVRMILNAHWATEDAENASRALTVSDREWITTCITVAKAVID